jgi:hypothetical protein
MDVVFRKVRERDIDLLLLEQLCCSAEFLRWFFLQVTKREPAHLKLVSAKHSVVGSLGQTDIEVTVVEDAGHKVVFLIENKIGSTRQPMQAERYEERRATYTGQECRVVLVTPKRYATKRFVEGYKSVLLLEGVLKWFEGNKVSSYHNDLKIALLQQALVPNVQAGDNDFRMKYWSVSQGDEFNVLKMPEPKPKPGRSIYFYPELTPKRVGFAQRLPQGRVEIIFRGKRNSYDALNKAVELLPTSNNIEVLAYPTSVAICTQVPRLVQESDFERQKEKVVEGLRAAVKLWEWFCDNKDTIMSAVS